MNVAAASLIEPLDAGRIRSALPGGTRLGGLSVHGAIDSTNSWLQERSLALPAPYACLTEHQLAGRGRRGRVWEDATGLDICLSLLWRFDVAQARAQGLSLAVGVAVVRALAATGASGIGLKWPNDIVWQDRKLGGILIEGSVSGRFWVVVIGVGINVHPGKAPDSRTPPVPRPPRPSRVHPRGVGLPKPSRGEPHHRDLGGVRALRGAGRGTGHR